MVILSVAVLDRFYCIMDYLMRKPDLLHANNKDTDQPEHLYRLVRAFVILTNAKCVGILTLISMINTTFEGHKARNVFICQYFSFSVIHEQLKFRAQLS